MRISIVADQHTARTAIDKARASHDDAATVFVTAAALDGLGEVPALEPVIVLPSDPSVMGSTGHEQYNRMLSMSGGTSVTAREWSQIKLAEFGWDICHGAGVVADKACGIRVGAAVGACDW